MIGSLPCLSHSAAHLAQVSAQAVQIWPLKTPFRATMCEAAEQTSAQSKHVLRVAKWWLLPSLTSVAQCRAHASHARWHFEQASAHSSKTLSRFVCSAPAARLWIAIDAKADKPAIP